MKFSSNITICFTTTNKAILAAWEQACQEVLGDRYEPECTSGLEGNHSLHSGHFYGRSLDFRIHDIYHTNHEPIRKKAQEILGHDYLVLIEDNPIHAHIQRNPETFTRE